MSSLKENVKETSTVEQSHAMKNLAVLSNMATRCKQHLQCSEKLSGLANIDMDKALKGLEAREPSSHLFDGCSENFTSTLTYSGCSQYNIVGQKAPLDFTLKTVMRIAASSSVNC
ncbi:hypothetical protein NL676_039351 [Syzygium grande]|nr:hypothetical protein NL676_039351 [Syzygium grande]